MKTILAFIIILLLSLSCGKAKKEETKAETKETKADKIARDFIHNMIAGDHQTGTADFSAELLAKYPTDKFTAYSKQINERLGKLNTIKYEHEHAGTDKFELAYDIGFDKDKLAGLHIAFKEVEGKIKIADFHFESSILAMPGEDKEHPIAVPESVEPVITNLLSAYNKGDYAGYTKDFCQAYQKRYTKEIFAQNRKEMFDILGENKSHKALRAFEKDKLVHTFYQAEYVNEEIVEIELVLEVYNKGEHGEKTEKDKHVDTPCIKKIEYKSAKMKQEKDQLNNLLKSMVLNLQENLDQKKYNEFSKDFSPEFKKIYTQNKFKSECQVLQRNLGKWLKTKATRKKKTDTGIEAYYRLEFEKDTKVDLKVVYLLKEGKYHIESIDFSSLNLPAKKT
jgi:hypothetical protein